MRDKHQEPKRPKLCASDCTGDETCEWNKVCMCGIRAEDHDDMHEGHSFVSQHDYHRQEDPK